MIHLRAFVLSIILFYNNIATAQSSIKIGSQIWTSTNLNVSTFANGDTIPEAKTNEEWAKAGKEESPAWCYYDNDPANGIQYGKLYNWYAVNDLRGLAPKGWHIPGDTEWIILTDYLGGTDTAGTKMKTISGWNKSGNGNNSSGFAAPPGGYRYDTAQFEAIGDCATWWSFTEKSTGSAWARGLYNYRSSAYRGASTKGFGLYVRCLLD